MMNYCMQYHNGTKRGLPFPSADKDLFRDGRRGIGTALPFVNDEIGSQVFMLVGFRDRKKTMRYVLWSTFIIEEVQKDHDGYSVRGDGWMLNPPQILEGKDLEQFQHDCANFAAFKRIGHLPFCKTLISLADSFHRQEWDEQTLKFCKKLSELLPKRTDSIVEVIEIRETVRKIILKAAKQGKLPKSKAKRPKQISGPIVRTGTTPEFWQNWDKAFGKAAGRSKTRPGKKAKKTTRKASDQKPVSVELTSGGGFSTSPQQTKAIDRYAMQRAIKHFTAEGYKVKRMPQVGPFDLTIRKGSTVLFVEVKGTRTLGEKIILTRNEFEFARQNKAKMILFVLHSIILSPDVKPRGGTKLVIEPWDVDSGIATPIQFSYEIGDS